VKESEKAKRKGYREEGIVTYINQQGKINE